ncbi:hypothetical protein [Streptomyces niveus]|uniref:hypothetical protein n=1 Tax=Streptomyces niveus TaxID=193462 RepID=UPI00084BF65E|nr:hypothetical protein [Streptomyces niveus]
MPDHTSTEIAGRIEDLYGAPLTDLQAHAQVQPPGMLAALLGMHRELALAERTIAFHRDRLARLVHPERQLGGHEVSHVLDCARRLAEAVAVRDAHGRATADVLQSLHRVPAPQGQAPAHEQAVTPPPAVPVPAAPSAPSR